MNKKVPQVSDLIDDAIIKVAEMMKDKSITPNTLSVCLNMLLNVDKNNRDIKSTFTKDLTNWSDEKLNAELSKFKGEQ
jgi:hypothetical protein